MPGSLRKVLAESHIGAITVACLFFLSFDSIFRTVWNLVYSVSDGMAPVRNRFGDHLLFPYVNEWMLIAAASSAMVAFLTVAGAWLVSLWVYGTDPVHCLAPYREKLRRPSCSAD